MSIIEEAAQLVKYNSIQGNKMNDIDVVYTMWGNLHKTEGMEVGQVLYMYSFTARKVLQVITTNFQIKLKGIYKQKLVCCALMCQLGHELLYHSS